MGRGSIVVFIAVVLAFGLARGAGAQVGWDTPLLIPPAPPAGIGFYLAEPHAGDIGALVTWRGTPGPGGIGLRGGIAESAGDELNVYGGVDVTGGLVRAGPSFPLDISWVLGVGAGFGGDGVRVSVPGALTFGRTIRSPEVSFTPYAGPRVTLDFVADDDDEDPPRGDDDEVDLDLSLDLGLDLSFGGGWAIRLGGSVGDRDGVAIGIIL